MIRPLNLFGKLILLLKIRRDLCFKYYYYTLDVYIHQRKKCTCIYIEHAKLFKDCDQM